MPSISILPRALPITLAVVGMACLGLLAPSAAIAQPPVETSYTLVYLDAVDSFKRDGQTYIQVKARCPEVPAGCKVDFVLTWKSRSIESYEVIPSDGAVETEFKVGKVPRTREDFYFRTIIYPEKQSSAVKKAIEKLPVAFDPDLAPWTDHHSFQKFKLFQAEEFKESRAGIRKALEKELELITKLEDEVREAYDLALIGERFAAKDGTFDVTAWRAWIDGHVLAQLKTLRENIATWHTESRFLPYQRSLWALDQLTNRVASRVLARSVELYEFYRLEPLRADVKPKAFERERVALERPLDLQPEIVIFQEELGIIPSDKVEYPFSLILKDEYRGVVWRHLTAEELAEGKFDEWRSQAKWTPDPELIAKAESALPAYLEEHAAPGLAEVLPFYRRQYLGMGPPERRILRIVLIDQASQLREDWLDRALAPKDDPGYISTIHYDVSTQSFQDYVKPKSVED